MTPNLRFLACLRLSADSDGSTSIEWQRRAVQHYVSAPHVSGILVAEAEDTDVSGSMSPFKRPKLGTWLNDRIDDFDVIIAAKMDRLTRRSMHFNELLEWAEKNGKSIVCVEEGFDLSTPNGKMMARMTAVFAEAEWDAIQARIQNGVKTRLENRSWLTGAPPTGYRIKSVEGERRKILEIDQDYWPVVKEIFDRINGGQSTHKIARDFNGRGLLTWGDHLRKAKGEVIKGTLWQATIINKFIRSAWVPGVYTYKGEAVLDANGDPVILPEKPLATMDEWQDMVDKIKPKAKAEGAEAKTRTGAQSLLGGIARCGNCDAPLSRVKGSGSLLKDGTRKSGHYYYRCTNKFRGGNCRTGSYIRTEELDAFVESTIRETIGQWDMQERAGVGPSQARELENAKARLAKLEADFLAGDYDGEGQEVSCKRMHKSLSGKVALLEKQEKERAHPALRPTGKKYGEVWKAKDRDGRREFLRTYGITVLVWKDPLPDTLRSDRHHGAIIDLGEIERMAEELKMENPHDGGVILHGWNVPPHWFSPKMVENSEERKWVLEVFGSVEIPNTIRKRIKESVT